MNEPTTVGEILQRKIRSIEEEPSFQDVAKRLTSVFGTGDNPTLRRELYERLQRACEQYGQSAYRIISGAVRSAKTAAHPDRYFAACVARRMREAGFFVDEVQSW